MKTGALNLMVVVLLNLLWTGTTGCSQRVPASNAALPDPPTAAQIAVWAGFPEGFQLSAAALHAPTRKQDSFGEMKWGWSYSSTNGPTGFQIALFEPGTLWRENRTKLVKQIEAMETKVTIPGRTSASDTFVETRAD